MTHLTIISGEASGSRHNLEKAPLTIGRSRECQIQLRDPMVSRRHARVYFASGQYWVEDLGSRNSTLVNGQKIANAQALHSGDRLEIGETTLVFESEVSSSTQSEVVEPRSPAEGLEETVFEDSVGPLWFLEQPFEANSLEILYRIASILNAGLGLPHLVRDSLGAIRSFFKANTACFFLTEQLAPLIQPTLVLSDEPSPPVSQRVVLFSLRSRRAVCVRDTRAELPPTDVVNQTGAATGRSLMCAPLIHSEKVFGAILVDHLQPNYFDHRSLASFTAIAHLIGGAGAQAQRIERLEAEVRMAQGGPASTEALTGVSPAIAKLHRQITEAAHAEEPVLIVGEYGSGKHEAAQAVHQNSPRQAGPLVWFHVLATEEADLASVLFGVSQGDANGVDQPGSGRVEAAHGGTLVIEEIGALPRQLQKELLAFLRTLKFQRVGAQRQYFSDARLIVTTSQPLEEAVLAGRFDPDLFAAIGVLTIVVPPLRDRGDDVVELAKRLVQELAPRVGRRKISLSAPVIQAFQVYRWPGNIRELRSVIERMVARARGDELVIPDLPGEILEQVHRIVPPTELEKTTDGGSVPRTP